MDAGRLEGRPASGCVAEDALKDSQDGPEVQGRAHPSEGVRPWAVGPAEQGGFGAGSHIRGRGFLSEPRATAPG